MKRKFDFSNVETFQRAPEGTHAAKIASVEETTFQSGNDGLKVAFEITKGAGKGARVYDNFPFADNSLWKLKTLLEALKIKCDGRIMLDTDKLIGKTLEIDVYHEEYEGKMRARLGEMRKLSNSKANEDDEDLDDEDDDIEDDDEEVEEKPKKKSASKKSPAKKQKKQPEPEDEDNDEEEDEEEEKPAKKSKKPAKKEPAKKSKKKEPEPEEDDDWDDDDDDWEDE